MTALGDTIRIKRKSIRMTLRGLSECTGVSLGYLSDIENGRHGDIGFMTIITIANILGISISILQAAYLHDVMPDIYPEYYHG